METVGRMPTEAPKPQQYFFMFSSGSYSDYSVGGLYVCSHKVPHEEWEAHYETYQRALKDVQDGAKIAYGKRIGCGHTEHHDKYNGCVIIGQNAPAFWNSDEWRALCEWKHANDPETTFIALHNMLQVEVTECWRDN